MDEINQINEIINKLDIIKDDEWQQQEGETLEEYNDRMESIEEDLEEELLDYISDSLLEEQEINEEKAIKEAQEKVNNDYEVFNEAFIKTENGTITLKSEEELASLGYNSPEEIEKLKEIEKNMNNPEEYINKIKESIQASKDIDAEIERKMELAKAIISAKKRGETLPNTLNPSLEKDKFEKANEYISNTTTLRKIPIIQREYIDNNYIAERRYNNFVSANIENNADNRTTNVTDNTQADTSKATTTISKVILKEIPERKNTVYANFERKLDKNNDLTKQKVKARTELKTIFKQIENKELSNGEVEELNSKIESIKNKYPNTITDKTVNKLYDNFKVILPTIKEDENTSKNNDIEPKVKMSKEELIEALKKAEMHSTEYIHKKGINLLIINKLICYLQDNNDSEIQERLNKEIAKLQTDRNESTDELYIYNPKQTNIQTLKYMYNSYKDGVKSNDGSREIISANPNAAAYYLYLANNVAQTSTLSENETDKKFLEKIKNEFESKKEDTCYRYFEFLKEKYNADNLDSINKLKAEALFMNELGSAKELKVNNSEYLDLAIAMEFVSRPRKNSLYTSEELEFKEKIQTFENKIKNREKIDPKILKLLEDMQSNGLKTVVGEDIVIQNKRKTRDMHEGALDEKSIYVCSDLHGEYPAYQAITSQLKGKDKLYILGDVIDRGTDGIKILQDVMERKEKGQVEFLIGNHELMMIQSLFLADKKAKHDWLSISNGGDKTLEAFEKLKPDEKNKIKEFLLDSYVYKNIKINSQNVHLVHAKSIQDKNDNSNKTVREMLAEGKEKLIDKAVWTRDTDGKRPHKDSAKLGIFTVIGHSPTKNNMIEYKNGALDIDCGAGGDEIASLVNLTTGKVKYFSVRHEREKVNNKQQER